MISYVKIDYDFVVSLWFRYIASSFSYKGKDIWSISWWLCSGGKNLIPKIRVFILSQIWVFHQIWVSFLVNFTRFLLIIFYLWFWIKFWNSFYMILNKRIRNQYAFTFLRNKLTFVCPFHKLLQLVPESLYISYLSHNLFPKKPSQ